LNGFSQSNNTNNKQSILLLFNQNELSVKEADIPVHFTSSSTQVNERKKGIRMKKACSSPVTFGVANLLKGLGDPLYTTPLSATYSSCDITDYRLQADVDTFRAGIANIAPAVFIRLLPVNANGNNSIEFIINGTYRGGMDWLV